MCAASAPAYLTCPCLARTGAAQVVRFPALQLTHLCEMGFGSSPKREDEAPRGEARVSAMEAPCQLLRGWRTIVKDRERNRGHEGLRKPSAYPGLRFVGFFLSHWESSCKTGTSRRNPLEALSRAQRQVRNDRGSLVTANTSTNHLEPHQTGVAENWEGKNVINFPQSRKSWILENKDDKFDINIGSEQNFNRSLRS